MADADTGLASQSVHTYCSPQGNALSNARAISLLATSVEVYCFEAFIQRRTASHQNQNRRGRSILHQVAKNRNIRRAQNMETRLGSLAEDYVSIGSLCRRGSPGLSRMHAAVTVPQMRRRSFAQKGNLRNAPHSSLVLSSRLVGRLLA